jgi:hypothetical protein
MHHAAPYLLLLLSIISSRQQSLAAAPKGIMSISMNHEIIQLRFVWGHPQIMDSAGNKKTSSRAGQGRAGQGRKVKKKTSSSATT